MSNEKGFQRLNISGLKQKSGVLIPLATCPDDRDKPRLFHHAILMFSATVASLQWKRIRVSGYVCSNLSFMYSSELTLLSAAMNQLNEWTRVASETKVIVARISVCLVPRLRASPVYYRRRR